MLNPFSLEDPRLRNGDKSMSFILSNYLNSEFDYVIFSSVVVIGDPIREEILKYVTAENYDVIGFTLTCSEETLRERHRSRGDENEISFYWLHQSAYPTDYVIHTDNKTPNQIVGEMQSIIQKASL